MLKCCVFPCFVTKRCSEFCRGSAEQHRDIAEMQQGDKYSARRQKKAPCLSESSTADGFNPEREKYSVVFPLRRGELGQGRTSWRGYFSMSS